ncbi:MAG TPA: hypothetical protein VES95_06920 [Dermatophilaceae bacterium]|nr:hypothetical protein [Dermatophilaceae bacterium]
MTREGPETVRGVRPADHEKEQHMAKRSIQGYVELASGLGEMTASRAKEAATELVALSGMDTSPKKVAAQTSRLAEDLLAAAASNRQNLVALVRREVEAAFERMDPALWMPAELQAVSSAIASLAPQVDELAAMVTGRTREDEPTGTPAPRAAATTTTAAAGPAASTTRRTSPSAGGATSTTAARKRPSRRPRSTTTTAGTAGGTSTAASPTKAASAKKAPAKKASSSASGTAKKASSSASAPAKKASSSSSSGTAKKASASAPAKKASASSSGSNGSGAATRTASAASSGSGTSGS